jgi:hypothetical protein
MSENTIQRIRGLADDLGYVVGLEGVTRIDIGSYSTEPFCERIFYQIWKGDELIAVVNDPAVAEITYKSSR